MDTSSRAMSWRSTSVLSESRRLAKIVVGENDIEDYAIEMHGSTGLQMANGDILALRGHYDHVLRTIGRMC